MKIKFEQDGNHGKFVVAIDPGKEHESVTLVANVSGSSVEFMSIDEMPAGDEINTLIAEKIFGHKVIVCDPTGFNFELNIRPCLVDAPKDQWGEMPYVPNYSTDIAAAWEVVEKLKAMEQPEYPFSLWLEYDLAGDVPLLFWHCLFSEKYESRANDAPLAICRAALKAVANA